MLISRPLCLKMLIKNIAGIDFIFVDVNRFVVTLEIEITNKQ